MSTKSFRSLAALAAVSSALVATPAFAHGEVPGSSHNWVQQQPTRFLNTDMAQVLPDALAYIDAGGGLGGFALGYTRGMGGGGELGFGLNAVLNTGAPFAGDVGAAWKQQFIRGENMAIAVRGGAFLRGLGGATAVGITAGLPITFDAGAGHLTVEPRLTFPNLSAGTGNGAVDVPIGFITPISPRWSLIADVTPTFGFGGGGFTLPVGIGGRFSPSPTSHVDFTFGQVNTTPAFGAQLGLVSVVGHVGF